MTTILDTGELLDAANARALHAAFLLVHAYRRGRLRAGQMDWSDVDQAHETAREALTFLAKRRRVARQHLGEVIRKRGPRRRPLRFLAQTLAAFLAQEELDPDVYPSEQPLASQPDLLHLEVVAVAYGSKNTRVVFLENGYVILETRTASYLLS